jgi:signal transduction histidine kinase
MDAPPAPDRLAAGRRVEPRLVALAWDVGPVLALLALGVLTLREETSQNLAAQYLVVAPLLVRRRWPIGTLVVVSLFAVATAVRTPSPWVHVGAVGLASFTVGNLGRDRIVSALVVLLDAAAFSLGLLAQDAMTMQGVVLPIVILVPTWVFGDVIRSRRVAEAQRVEARERALREADERLRIAVEEERRRMARELHDVVAHAVSVMLIQAGAARQVVETSPERATEALLTVESTGREAMAELRRLLGVLNDDGEAAGLAPQPGLADVGPLIDRVHEAGLPVELEVSGTPVDLPASLDVTVYRIVQEALTNALRYARGARTVVRLAWDEAQLRVEVLDDGPSSPAEAGEGSGRGLVGMRERAGQVGGRLEAGPRLGGGYAVRAWLPLGEAGT